MVSAVRRPPCNILDTEVEDLFPGGDLGDELLEDVGEGLACRGVLCEAAGVSGAGGRGGAKRGGTYASSERPFWTCVSVCGSCGFLRSTGADMVV